MRIVDCAIIGGSYSGLSATLALARSMRSAVVIDDGLPCNRFAPHSHNFLTHDGGVPGEIGAIGRQQIVENYKTVDFVKGRVVRAIKDSTDATTRFQVTTDAGDVIHSRKIIIATGVKDIVPDIPGFLECWGKSVIHCPYCHGYEFNSKPTGILFSNPQVVMHQVPLIRNLTPQVKLFLNGQELPLTDEESDRFKKNDIELVPAAITEIKHVDGYMNSVVLADGTCVPLEAIYAYFPFELNGKEFIDELGCEINEHGFIAVDQMQKTNVGGVFAVGDVTSRLRAVANAVYGGNIAGAIANMELSNEDFAARN